MSDAQYENPHLLRGSLQAAGKYVEHLTTKATNNIPGAESMVTTAKKVSSPVMQTVRRIGDPIIDAMDNGINNISKNVVPIAQQSQQFAKARTQQGIDAAFKATDRMLSPTPNESGDDTPHTVRGLWTTINQRISYISKTKLKPILGFDPYDKMVAVIMLMWSLATFAWILITAPFYSIRGMLEPYIIWMIGHKCPSHDAVPGVDERNEDAPLDEVSASGSNRSGITRRAGGQATASTVAAASSNKSSKRGGTRGAGANKKEGANDVEHS